MDRDTVVRDVPITVGLADQDIGDARLPVRQTVVSPERQRAAAPTERQRAEVEEAGMPQFSEQVGDLITALALAQLKFNEVEKNRTARIKSTRANYKYEYADLDAYMQAVRMPLAENGMVVFQFPAYEPGFIGIRTRLVHSSGQWVQNYVRVPWDTKSSDQKDAGISMTYARRYGLTSLLALSAGMPDTDGHREGEADIDDGEIVQIAAVRDRKNGGAIVRTESGVEYVTDSDEMKVSAQLLAESGAECVIQWEPRTTAGGDRYRHLTEIVKRRG